MTFLSNTQSVSPIAFIGRRQPEFLRTVTNCSDQMKFVLIGVGGVGIDNFPLEQWPELDDVTWIFPDNTLACSSSNKRADFVPQSQFEMNYIDLLSSCDLVLTKTGYGTQTESVVNKIPTICITRPDWPEHEYLSNWHEKHGDVEFIEWNNVGTPAFAEMVVDMLGKALWTRKSVIPNGAKEAANTIHRQLLIDT